MDAGEFSPHCPFKNLDLLDRDADLPNPEEEGARACDRCLSKACHEENDNDEELGLFFIAYCPTCGWEGEYEKGEVDVKKIMEEMKAGTKEYVPQHMEKAREELNKRHARGGCPGELIIA
jgi:hypothetical protein